MTSTAGLLPNAKQQFIDVNGKPLVGGLVYFFVPGTTAPKTTWEDPNQLTPTTNPVVLDSRGQALIYGVGQYRQVLRDSLGNTIWDQLTEFEIPGGTTNAKTLIIVALEGKPNAAESLPPASTGVTVTFPAGLTSSTGYALTAPTGNATFTFKIYPGATTVATATFAVGQHIPTFTAASPFTLGTGQAMVPIAPSSQDATLSDVTIAFQGT